VTTRTISKRQKIPYHFLRRAASVLVAEGLMTASRGQGGGVRLARPPADISLLEIVNAFGGIALNDCTFVPSRCSRTRTCPAYPAWVEAQAVIERTLGETKLDSLLTTKKPRTAARKPRGRRRPGAAGNSHQ
jgi:Rrf2 family protein